MSHTSILDKIGRLFVNPRSPKPRRGRPPSLATGSATTGYSFTGEDCQESDFDRECFVNISIQVIAQFLKRPDALQDLGRAEPGCQCSSFFCRTRQTTLRYTIPGPQNIRPPGE